MAKDSSTGSLPSGQDIPTRSVFARPGTQSFSPPNSRLGSLASDILTQMHAAWDAGLPINAERWISQIPQLAANPETAVLVVYEELCLREEAGEKVNSAEIIGRFPQWESALRVVLDCHRLFQAESVVFPEAGSELGELRLLRELGRGGAGRVFLASQPSLSDRLLAVKLAPRTGEEHLSLARLQHTHIVPLYSVVEFPEKNLRALCMPFLGGATWSAILHGLAALPPAERTGQKILQQFQQLAREQSTTASATGPAIGFLARASYVQAVCWVGSCLADALHYAHERGLMHLDIKPSNVLLAGDGQPMLLDFHLAHEIKAAGQGRIDRIGGTHGYMSPEQQRCAMSVREGSLLPVGLDARSDIYSLGVLLYESLAGVLPKQDERASRAALRRLNPQVSRGLEDVLHKCLAGDPSARYFDAAALADDLRRQLADLPLRGVANRSLTERWQKWRRRKPHWLPVLATGAAALAVTGSVCLLFYRDRVRAAGVAAVRAEQEITSGNYALALARSTAGLESLGRIPGQADLKQTLQSQRALAQHARIAQGLHELVEQLRFVENFDELPPAELRKLDVGCAAVWQLREQIAALDGNASHAAGLDHVRTDLLDLALLWTNLALRIAPDVERGRAKAFEVLDQAKALCGPSPVLARARAELIQPAGAAAQAVDLSALEPKTAWEHNAVGRNLMQQGQLAAAQDQFEQAVRLEPGAFWPNFNLMLCVYRRGEFAEALQKANVSVALGPTRAECFFNRALCQEALGHGDLALADLTRAAELKPNLASVALHRGIVLGQLGDSDSALTELRRAVALGSPPGRVAYETAAVHAAKRDWPAARAAVADALRHDADNAPALDLKSRLDSMP